MRRLPVVTVAWAAFALTAAAAVLLYPAPVAPVSLRITGHPRVPPGALTLEATMAASSRPASARGVSAELRVIRIGRAGDRTVILQPESGDAASLSLEPGRSFEVSVPLPVVADAEEILIAALLFPDPDPDYLRKIGERQTVSPGGIAPHARAAIVYSIGPRGVDTRIE
jgi:hypothetical protein